MTQEIGRRLVNGEWVTNVADESGGGGSQPGAVRLLDLGVVAASDAAMRLGPVTLYTPEAGEIVGPVYLRDVVYMGANSITIGRDEQLPEETGGNDFPPLAFWDGDLAHDSAAVAEDADNQKLTPTTTGPVRAGFSAGDGQTGLIRENWAAATEYAEFAEIIAFGHAWYASPGGTSGGSEPAFVANEGGTVVDNNITWNDGGALSMVGSAHVYAQVATPVAP